MAASDVSKPLAQRLTYQLTRLRNRWGKEAISLIAGWTLWMQWTAMTWLAFVVSLLFIEVGDRASISVLSGLTGGVLIGVAQWLVIRPYLTSAYRWIGVSVLCWGLLALFDIGAIGWVAPSTFSLWIRALCGLLYGGYAGLIIGLGQWWVIRREVSQAWRWIPLTAGIWAVAIAFGWLLGGVLRLASNLYVGEVVGLLLAWGAIASLSGIAVVGILNCELKTLNSQLGRSVPDEANKPER